MSMNVSCPQCQATFPVDPNKIPPGGITARCSQCSGLIEISPPAQAEAPAVVPEVETESEWSAAEEPAVEEPSAPEMEAAPESAMSHEPMVEEHEEPDAEEPDADEPPFAEPTFDEPSFEASEPEVEAQHGEPIGVVPSAFDDGDATVVADIDAETEDEFGEREISFGTEAPVEEPPAFGTMEAEATPAYEEPYEEATVEEAPVVEEADAEELPAFEESHEVAAVDEAPAPEAPAEEETPSPEVDPVPEAPTPPPATPAVQFGRRSPEDKAKSLARSLVSDIVAYHPQKHHEAFSAGNLPEVFEEEIEKCWKEYAEQVDPGIVANNHFFNDALNEILAKGQSVFNRQG